MKSFGLTKKQKKKLRRIVIASISFALIFLINKIINLSSVFSGNGRWIFPFALYFCVYIFIGYDVIIKALKNIKNGQIFDENFLMIIATFGAFGLAIFRGVNNLEVEGFDEACAVLLFYQIGEFFQNYAVSKSRKSIASLMNIRPDYANLKTESGTSVVLPTEIKIGDIVLVNPGEKIPVDGVIVKGNSSIDTKALTGESILQSASVGDNVLSGTINIDGQLEVQASKLFEESSVSKILNLVENVSTKKSSAENFISKFARIYTPIICIFALFLAVIPSLIFGNFNVWLYRALSFLVVSCPCALVISIPLAFFVGIGYASKNGILVKGSNYFEQINKSKIFLFDKTGTITKGDFEIVEILPKEREKEILELATIAEQYSNHPIALSIKNKFDGEIEAGYSLQNVAGAGVVAIKDDVQILCGNEKLMKEYNIPSENNKSIGTSIFVAKNGEYIGCINIADKIKDNAKETILQLNEMGIDSIMLTGDSDSVAKQIATEACIAEYYSSLLPQDKIEIMNKIISNKNQKHKICFVGDGINDAPALMLADIGISMGGVGSDAAIEASDVVLMKDDLSGILKTKQIAKKVMKTVFQNIVFSISVKVLILILTAIGITNMWLAIFGDVGVAVLAILNSMKISHK